MGSRDGWSKYLYRLGSGGVVSHIWVDGPLGVSTSLGTCGLSPILRFDCGCGSDRNSFGEHIGIVYGVLVKGLLGHQAACEEF